MTDGLLAADPVTSGIANQDGRGFIICRCPTAPLSWLRRLHSKCPESLIR